MLAAYRAFFFTWNFTVREPIHCLLKVNICLSKAKRHRRKLNKSSTPSDVPVDENAITSLSVEQDRLPRSIPRNKHRLDRPVSEVCQFKLRMTFFSFPFQERDGLFRSHRKFRELGHIYKEGVFRAGLQ